MDLTSMTPAEVDALWLTAMEPVNRLLAQSVAKSQSAVRYKKWGGHYAEQAEKFSAQAQELFEKFKTLRTEVEPPFMAEWNARGGWTRAYLVPDGHIHKTTACQSLYPTTQISWLPEQSGNTEDEIVAAAGVMACTFCYPSAPVEALRAAEAAEKAKGECPGSRTYNYEQSTFRRTSYTGSGMATCTECGERVNVTTSGKIKVHKRKAAES